MLELFYAIYELMPLAFFINMLLVCNIWYKNPQTFFIIKINIEKTRFFNKFDKQKNPENNIDVDTKKKKQKKSSNEPTEIKVENP